MTNGTVKNSYAAPNKEFIRRAFDTISQRYDLLNEILSFGNADRWRKKACGLLLKRAGNEAGAVLDLGVGTADSLKWFLKKKKWRFAAGLDFSGKMLCRAARKISGAFFVNGDFHELPFAYGSFDVIFSAFTLRSVQNMPKFLAEIKRVLKPGGKVGFLDLTRPRSILHKIFFFPYLRFFLPLVGRLISGSDTAYQFLSQSVQNFQSPERTLEVMRQAGFRELSTKSFSFGAATLIIATK